MLKVTICGSWSDLDKIFDIKKKLEEHGYIVIAPNTDWLYFCRKEIQAHHINRGNETDINARKKALNLLHYFDFIKESNFIYVYNMKNDKQYIGLNTAMEIGVALWLGKPVYFYTQPVDYELRELAKVWRL